MEEALLDRMRINPASAKRISGTLQKIAESGTGDADPAVYKPIRDGLYEIKERNGLFRILAFRDVKRNRLVVLIRAFEKNPGSGIGSKQQDEQIRLALKYKREYEHNDFTIMEV